MCVKCFLFVTALVIVISNGRSYFNTFFHKLGRRAGADGGRPTFGARSYKEQVPIQRPRWPDSRRHGASCPRRPREEVAGEAVSVHEVNRTRRCGACDDGESILGLWLLLLNNLWLLLLSNLIDDDTWSLHEDSGCGRVGLRVDCRRGRTQTDDA